MNRKGNLGLLAVLAVVGVAAMMFASGGITGAVSANAACNIHHPNKGTSTVLDVLDPDSPALDNNCFLDPFSSETSLFETCNSCLDQFIDSCRKINDPGCVEIVLTDPCNDNLDNDNNGEIDCNDAACGLSEFCAPEADLELVSINGPTTVMTGDLVMFDATVRNNGPNTATGVIVTYGFSAGLTPTTPPAGGSCSGGTCTVPLSDIPNGGVVNVPPVVVQVSGGPGSLEEVEATVVGGLDDGNPLNNGDLISLNTI